MAAWNGSTWGPGSAPTFSGSFAAGQLTFTVNRSDLGGTSAFEFGLFTSGDSGATTPENAPDLGYWSYEVSLAGETPPPPPAPPAPSAQALTVMGFPFVSTAKAGGLLTVHLVVFLDGNLPLEDGQVNCSAHIGARVLRVQGKLGPLLGVLSCTWRVPKNTHGKRLSGTIGVTFENATVSSPFSAKIK